MRPTLLRIFSVALLGALLAGTAGTPAYAGGGWRHGHGHHGHFGFRHHGYRHHGHSSFVLGLNFLVPLYRPYYYDPPPPRVVYVERPPVCRRFNGNATIDASGRPFYGTACLRADGRWHIVN